MPPWRFPTMIETQSTKPPSTETPSTETDLPLGPKRGKWRSSFGRDSTAHETGGLENDNGRPTKWSMGVLNDRLTHEVPGSVLLLTGQRNEPLGLRNASARTSGSSLPSPYPTLISRRPSQLIDDKKKTKNGAIILEPQPDDSHNDPLNWPSWRRDSALLSLGLYCMVGGGMTPVLAAGFTNVAQTYQVTVPQVALTTGLYMMGLGVGSVLASPTAILYGKRPVYLVSSILFIATSAWCAASPSYISLVIARVFQGMSVSPVECLPSATIAEIFFLHERAYRIGIYTLLLLGGKNLIPLVSAAIIQSLGWRWVFWIFTIVVGFCWILLFLFVPETFWDRTPRPKHRKGSQDKSIGSFFGMRKLSHTKSHPLPRTEEADTNDIEPRLSATSPSVGVTSIKSHDLRRPPRSLHAGFTANNFTVNDFTVRVDSTDDRNLSDKLEENFTRLSSCPLNLEHESSPIVQSVQAVKYPATDRPEGLIKPSRPTSLSPQLRSLDSPSYELIGETQPSYPWNRVVSDTQADAVQPPQLESNPPNSQRPPGSARYTSFLKDAPQLSFIQQLKPWNGRLHHDNWFHVAFRPFILFSYPAVLWSAIVYSCSIGWLIVLSESVAEVFRSQSTYNFSALSTGLIYLSPFIGGILGTAVAGKVSDIIVRAMSRRNGGLYEPEFRLVMAIPIAITTVIGLMGFGWSAEVHDTWIVPTIFFAIISFGCSLGSTTAITFCVDSYRVYAGEALVTLNFSKNIFHGLVFSLFFNTWLAADGSKNVFVALGGIQLAVMMLSIPMYIFGKRARMWTVRKNFMEKF